ncbi:MAG TPA: polysaccharide deacetylase family protein [Spirochaetota bacterium]|jgi:peptidoglycan/xylan/chitin deacetylase (PgdA/CDA1 family)|nr:MAG: Poly-beta-1,6-N-acetyl-D-glucosamine N-deacetylase precursor [Spirochaetes bacterium ADurb.BinA120]HPI14838.1 polysaccharide deacetylase family protein [Spirochaetota bacterium]HPO46029.1 polysaccharide deacetylase family protein [Spirochaetota bacterium]
MKYIYKNNLPILFAIFFITGVAVYLLLFWRSSTFRPLAQGSSGWQHLREEETGRLNSVPVLLYHNIDGKGPFSVDLDALRGHFTLLRDSGIRVLSLSEFVERLGGGCSLEERAIAISFDDGFLSMHTKLLPLSREFGYPITLFVYTDNVYVRADKNITWKRLRELDAGGVTVEGHSLSHADLVRLNAQNTPESKKRLFDEIYLSKRILEKYLGKEIKYFAFPYGRYNIPLIRMCMNAGYERVFSTDYGSNVLTRDNYCLRRHHIKRKYSFEHIEKIVR